MRRLNWFTIAALMTIITLVAVGVPMIVLTELKLDHIAVVLIMGFAAVTAAVLSLHFKDRD